MTYKHILNEEREIIAHLFNVQKLSISKIANQLNRHKSTISREIKRNESNGFYEPNLAHKKYLNRKWHSHSFYLTKYNNFSELFKERYDKRYSSVEISLFKMKQDKLLDSYPSIRQIYNWIRSNRWIIKRSDKLRIYCKNRKRKIGIFSKFKNNYVLPIWTRSKSVDLRNEYGHWEIDLIIGKKSNGFANILTMVERKTRIGYIAKVYSKNPMKINSEIYKIIKENNLIVKTITMDNGIEFSKIGLLAKWIKCKVYYCEPYASYQRGSNENFNGLIRRWYKKGFDFTLLSDKDIRETQNKINNMPRKILGYKSSFEVNQYYIN